MEMRNMRIADYESIYSLWMSCAGMGLNNLDDSREGIERFLKRNPDTCFVAVDGDKTIGVIMAGNDGRRGYIYHTSVHPEYRNKGIGTALVDKTMSALEKAGIHKVALVVFERNDGGNAFWESIGFTAREDLVYRNRAISEMIRIDT